MAAVFARSVIVALVLLAAACSGGGASSGGPTGADVAEDGGTGLVEDVNAALDGGTGGSTDGAFGDGDAPADAVPPDDVKTQDAQKGDLAPDSADGADTQGIDVAPPVDVTVGDALGDTGPIVPDAIPDTNPPDTNPPNDVGADVPDAGIPPDTSKPPVGPQPCLITDDCESGVCDPEVHACVTCYLNAQCGSGKVCTLHTCGPAVACDSDTNCKATQQVCDKPNGVCVDCVTDADCGGDGKCTGYACAAPPPVCASTGCQGATAYSCKPDGSGYVLVGPCNDDNPCTDDTCEPGIGCTFTPNAAPCNDSNTCTAGDICAGGVCKGASICDDGNPCTTDSCDPAAKPGEGCKHDPGSGAACDDGDPCSTGDVCTNGSCGGMSPKACDDGNPCTTDTCDSETGACTAVPKDCDDQNVCTTDACEATTGVCGHVWKADCSAPLAPCDTSADCLSGVCELDTRACVQCLASSDCGAGKLCQGRICKAAITCVSDAACKATDEVCSLADGVCVSCVGEADCNAGDKCIDHACVAAPTCTSSKQCPSVCDTVKGYCVECTSNEDCPKDKFCGTLGQCRPLVCGAVGCTASKSFACKADGSGYAAGVSCDDANACTEDACDAGVGCESAPKSGSCDDGNACTFPDTCQGGLCSGGSGFACDDGNPCTTDSCDKVAGCKHAPNTFPCDDGDACTKVDLCKDGNCVPGSTTVCNDGNACTFDACDPKSGNCTAAAKAGPCDDGNACTSGDMCIATSCVGGPAPNCDDGNPCTTDSCDPNMGCKHVAVVGDPTCTPVGTDPSNPAASCAKVVGGVYGQYWIDPDGVSGPVPATKTLCTFELDGGGWTLVALVVDDGQNTWTWANRLYWSTNTTTFGTPADVAKDFKSPLYHTLPGKDLLFYHSPSGVWAGYHGILDGAQSLAKKVESFGADLICWQPGLGIPMSAGTLSVGANLCSTNLYFNFADHDGNPTKCGDDEHTWGPGWSARTNSPCPFDDPGLTGGLGPCYNQPNTEIANVGFAAARGLNSGAPGSGTNRMSIWVR